MNKSVDRSPPSHRLKIYVAQAQTLLDFWRKAEAALADANRLSFQIETFRAAAPAAVIASKGKAVPKLCEEAQRNVARIALEKSKMRRKAMELERDIRKDAAAAPSTASSLPVAAALEGLARITNSQPQPAGMLAGIRPASFITP